MYFVIGKKERYLLPQKLETILKKVEEISNDINKHLIKDYHRYLISRDTSRNYQKDNIKLINLFANFYNKLSTLFIIEY
jgi:hypothetical protein